jgi:hypothetical protein
MVYQVLELLVDGFESCLEIAGCSLDKVFVLTETLQSNRGFATEGRLAEVGR